MSSLKVQELTTPGAAPTDDERPKTLRGPGGRLGRGVAVAWAIAQRELSSLFRLPVGWVVIALFAFLSAVLFVGQTLEPGSPASLRYFFSPAAILMIAVAPAISMRLLSEEFRTGTIETLTTSPVGEASVVWGKYIGSVVFLVLMLAPTLAFPGVLLAFSDPAPDIGPIISGYIALLLAGSLYLAIGTLASCLTSSQTLAFLATLIALVLLLVVTSPQAAGRAPPLVGDALLAMSVPIRAGDLARGVLDLRHVVFFGSASVAFVTLAAAALSLRRAK